jgi:hypothetical protein
MYIISILFTAFIMFVIGIVIGYLGGQREAESLRDTLRDTRIELANIKLGYTDGYGDKKI